MVSSVSFPNQVRNYCIFDENRISQKKNLDVIKNSLQNPSNDEDVVESLYALNLMIDEGEQNAGELYPLL